MYPTHLSMRRRQGGFTLVEIAIVLVIIGLLLGGVLKGQEMITNAKYKNLYNQFRELTAATYTSYDKYKAYPGDDNGAVVRWGATTANGNGQGWIDAGAYCAGGGTAESCLAWQHLRLAKILSGSTDATEGRRSATHAFGGRVALSRTDSFIGGWAKPLGVCFEWLNNASARWLESSYDDKFFNQGSIRGNANYMAGSEDGVVANHTCLEM